jgi:hypothetical protein
VHGAAQGYGPGLTQVGYRLIDTLYEGLPDQLRRLFAIARLRLQRRVGGMRGVYDFPCIVQRNGFGAARSDVDTQYMLRHDLPIFRKDTNQKGIRVLDALRSLG